MKMERLTTEDEQNIFEWLKEHSIEFDAERLHRDFSDGVNVAKILKKTYPRLIIMNNYPKCNSVNRKIKNWETLNYKVLGRIGLRLSEKAIIKLARGKPSLIESLLFQIMQHEIAYKREHDTKITLQEQIWVENEDVVTRTVKRVVNGEIVEVPEKLILSTIFNKAVKESEMLSEDISFLAQKIEHLEELQQLVSEQFNEIYTRLAKSSDDTFELDLSNFGIPPLDLREILAELSSGSSRKGKGHATLN